MLRWWSLKLWSTSLLPARCNWYRLTVNCGNIWTKYKWRVLNPPINKETKPPGRRQIMDCGSAHRLSGFRKLSAWGPGKRSWLQKEGSLNRSGLIKCKGAQKEEGEVLLEEGFWKWWRSWRLDSCVEMNAVGWPGRLAGNAQDWRLQEVSQQEPTWFSA